MDITQKAAVPSDQTPAVVPEVVRPTRHFDAYKRWEGDYAALSNERVIPSLNVDIPGVTAMVSGSITRIVALKAEAVAKLPAEDHSVFDIVESQALGLSYTFGRHQAASLPALSLPALSVKLVACLEILSDEYKLAVKRGLVSDRLLKELKGPVGYKNQASDTMALVALFRDNAKALAGRTGLKPTDIDEAEMYADQMYVAIGEREQLPATTAATLDTRQRAFTLFMQTYDAVRRIVHYLRWNQGDANEIAPSVYAGRRRKGGDKPDEDGAEEPASDAAKIAAAAAPTADSAQEIPVGMPGARPYTT